MRFLPLHRFVAIVLVTTLLAPPFAAPSRAAEDSGAWRGNWWNYYERGLSRSEKGEWGTAIEDMREAIDRREQDQRRARTYGMHFVDYFPHRELGVLYFNTGKIEQSIAELELSLRSEPTDKTAFYLNRARQVLLNRSSGIRTPPPLIVVTSPAAGQLTARGSIRLTGRAGGPGYVSKITVNGAPYRIDLARQEISFNKEITLEDGRNSISIVAEDLLGGRSEQVVTVTLKRDGPVITLAESRVVEQAGSRFVKVIGEVLDSAGIASLVVAGAAEQPLSQPAYRFERVIPVETAPASITVEATDIIGNRTLAEVAVQPPTADTAAQAQAAREEEERLRKAEEERLAKEQAEAELVARAQAEKLRLAWEKAEAERLARHRTDQERLERERAEQERLMAELAAARQAEAARLARLMEEEARLAREKAELAALIVRKQAEEQAAREQETRQSLARERAEQVRRELEQVEQERIAREKAEAERLVKEKAEQERLAREQVEQERIAREKAEAERLAKEKADQDRMASEQAERERQARLIAEQKRIERELIELERLAQEKAEAERAARARAEAERLAREKAEQERLARIAAEQERQAHLKAEQERIEREKAELERLAKEKAEQERLAQEQAEAERHAAEKAEQERLARERDEQERLARERLVWQKLEAERITRENEEKARLERERQAFEAAERERLARLASEKERKAREREKERERKAAQAKSRADKAEAKAGPAGPDTEPPMISLEEGDEPQAVFGIDTYAIQGYTTDNNQVKSVRVGGVDLSLPAGPKVYFSKTVRLKEGQNRIAIESVDQAGNRAVKEVIVHRTVPSVMQPTSRTSLLVLPDPGGRDPGTVTPVLDDYLAGAFVKQKRFKMIERKKIKQVLDEQKFSAAMSDPEQVIRIGNMAAADMVIAGTVREDAKSVEVLLRVINSETSEQVAQVDGYTEDKRRESVQLLMESIASKVAENFPVVEGVVIERDAGEVMANVGSQSRLKQNMGVIFFRRGGDIKDPVSGRVIGVKTIQLGDGRINEVQSGFSKILLSDKAAGSDIAARDMFVTK